MKRLIEIIENAYDLAMETIDMNEKSEEVAGECGEFLALWNEDNGFFDDDISKDKELERLVKKLKEKK